MENEGAFLLSQDQGKEFLRDHLEYFPRDLWNPEVMLAESDWEGPHLVGTSDGGGERLLHQVQPEPTRLSEQSAWENFLSS